MADFIFTSKVTLDFNAENVLSQSKIDEAQKLLVELVATKSDPYVPWLTGDLRRSCKKNKKSITYYPWHGGNKSYANVQWRYNRGMGREGFNRGGLRGDKWTERMLRDHKDEIVAEIARKLGGSIG